MTTRAALLEATAEVLYGEVVELPIDALHRVAAEEQWPADQLRRILDVVVPALERQYAEVALPAIEAAVDRAYGPPVLH